MQSIVTRTTAVLALVFLLAGCETLGQTFESPNVALSNVRLQSADMTTQKFVLDFTVSNPNGVPLPVRAVNYGVTLAGISLASGSTEQAFRVPANGDGSFSVSVETSLIDAVKMLGTRLLKGGEQELEYSVGGSVALDVPLVRPLPFSATGVVQIKRD
ncbi:MAG: LEA type 2 family protein [Pseudomonadota bacterium]